MTELSADRRVYGLRAALALIAGVWIVADAGYRFVLPVLGVNVAYTAEPVVIALYYAAWVAIALAVFWPLYWPWPTHENPVITHIVLLGLLGSILLFAVYGLPALPRIVWTEPWDPPELMRVTAWYFVPKATEILFQQLLIAALVLAFAHEGYALRAISFICAALFGGMHIMLALGGMPLGYVVRFMLAAAAFGLIFPLLLLRAANGLAWSYSLHWSYYLVTIVMAHTLSPYAQY